MVEEFYRFTFFLNIFRIFLSFSVVCSLCMHSRVHKTERILMIRKIKKKKMRNRDFSFTLFFFTLFGVMVGTKNSLMMNELFGVVTMTDMYYENWCLMMNGCEMRAANKATHSNDEGKMFTEHRYTNGNRKKQQNNRVKRTNDGAHSVLFENWKIRCSYFRYFRKCSFVARALSTRPI